MRLLNEIGVSYCAGILADKIGRCYAAGKFRTEVSDSRDRAAGAATRATGHNH
jgi:ABC-type phosphate/phosphonate transport system permease subunit